MKKAKRILVLSMLVCVLAAGTVLATGFSRFLESQNTYTVTEEEYALIEKYRRLEEIAEIVDELFLWEYDTTELIEGAAQGMLGALGDDYSFYYTPDRMTEQVEQITGEYGGLGIEVFGNANDNTITIRRVFYGGPAQKAGLKPIDKIIRVNGEDMTAQDMNAAVAQMRGEIGGEVTVTILRDQEVFDVTMARELVQTEIIGYEMLDDGIAYVRVHYFEGNLLGQFEEAMQELIDQGAKGLVVDLRDNPGGLVDLAVGFADYFLDDAVVFRTEDKYGRQRAYYGREGSWDIPLVILQNGYSASASEILAITMQENGRAKVVGTQSFGKGIMQVVIPFSDDGSGMQLTTEYWLSPEGNNIHEVGITPDLELELDEEAIDENHQFIKAKDNQLQQAIKVLLEEIEARETDEPAA